MQRQLVLMGILEDCITVSSEAMSDVRLQNVILQLLSLFCNNSSILSEKRAVDEYCVYLTNAGLFEYIQTVLSLQPKESELFVNALQIYRSILQSSCSCLHFCE